MSPIPTLLTGIPSILKGAYLLGHEPKRGDFTNTYLEESLQNVISNNQADIVNKTLLNQATSGAKSIGARMQQQSQHGLDVARESGLLSEGQHAQALLQSGAEIQSKVGEQYQQLLGENVKYTAGLQDKVDQARLQLGAAKDEARRQYLAAHNQWEAELWGTGMDLATVGVNAVTKGLADQKNKEAIDKIVNGIKGGNIKDWDSSDWGQAATMFQLYAYGLDLGKLKDSGAVPAGDEEVPAGDGASAAKAPIDYGSMTYKEMVPAIIREDNLKEVLEKAGATIDPFGEFAAVARDGGGYSTVDAISFFDDRGSLKDVLIPTIIDGKKVSNDEAIRHYRETNQHFGMYGTPSEADQVAKLIHENHEKRYAQKGTTPATPGTPAKPTIYSMGQFGLELNTPYAVGTGKAIQPGAITGVLQVGTAPLQDCLLLHI